MWSFGCIFGSVLFCKQALFAGKARAKQLKEIVKILGSEALSDFIKEYEFNFLMEVSEHCQKIDWRKPITEENAEVVTDEAIDLLEKPVVLDPRKRLCRSSITTSLSLSISWKTLFRNQIGRNSIWISTWISTAPSASRLLQLQF